MEKAISPLLRPSEYLPAMADRMSLVKESKKYSQNYVIYRIGLKPIEVDQTVRDAILELMMQNKKFIQIDEYTIMINSISSIEPLPIKKPTPCGEYVDGVWVEDKKL